MKAQDVVAALKAGGLTPVVSEREVYAYADGPRTEAIESEWLLAFVVEADTVTDFAIQKRLVGP